MSKIIVFFTCWFIHVAIVDVACAENTDELISQFKNHCQRFPSAGVVKYDVAYPEPNAESYSTSEVRFRLGYRSFHGVTPARQGTIYHESALLSNPHYSATIRKQEGGWVINEGVKPSGSQNYFTGDNTLFSVITNPGQILTKAYRFESSTKVPLGGVDYSVVTLASDSEEPLSVVLVKLWFRLEGDRVVNHYPERVDEFMKKAILEPKGPGAFTRLFSEFVSLGGYRFPSRMQTFDGIITPEQWDARQTKLASTMTLDYSLIDTTPRVTEFYLTHYGLPEPDFYTPPWPWWLYASASGVGLVLIGVLLLQLGRRLRRRS
jgi:hypothetical protein